MPQFFKTFGYAVHGMGKTYHGCTNEGNLLAKGYCDIPKSWGEDPAFPYFPYVREHCSKGSFCEVKPEDEPGIFDYQLANHTVGVLHAIVAQDKARATLSTANPTGPTELSTNGAPSSTKHGSKDNLNRRALNRRGALSKPFALFVGFKKPHAPWGSPSRFFDRYNLSSVKPPTHPTAPLGMPPLAFIHNFRVELPTGDQYDWGPEKAVPSSVAVQMRRGYYAAVSFMDEQVGKILKALDDLDLQDSTVTVFTSDHGKIVPQIIQTKCGIAETTHLALLLEHCTVFTLYSLSTVNFAGYHLGEHGEWEKKANFELANRVPLIIASPNKPSSHGSSTMAIADLVVSGSIIRCI
jgi:arylsulfatase A-like enzyme